MRRLLELWTPLQVDVQRPLSHTVDFMEIVSEMSTLCSKLFHSTDNEHDSS